MQQNKKLIIITMCIVLFLDAVSSGIEFPLLPILFMNAEHGLIAHGSIHYRNLLFGIFFITFPVAGLIGAPLLGTLSDRIGRKHSLLIGVFLIILTQITFISSIILHNVWLFLLGGVLLGFAFGTYSVAYATIMDISESEEGKVAKLRYPMAAVTSGAIVGPGLSAFIFDNDVASLSIPFMITLSIAIVNFLLLLAKFPESTTITEQKSTGSYLQIFKNIFASIQYMFNYTKIRKIVFAYCLLVFGINFYYLSLSMYLHKAHHFDVQQIGVFFIVMEITTALSMLTLHKFVLKIMSINSQIMLGLLVAAFSLLMDMLVNFSFRLFHVNTNINIWIASIIFFAFIPFILINTTQVFSSFADADNQGKILGGKDQLAALSIIPSGIGIGYISYLHENLLLIIAGCALLASYFIFRQAIKSNLNIKGNN